MRIFLTKGHAPGTLESSATRRRSVQVSKKSGNVRYHTGSTYAPATKRSEHPSCGDFGHVFNFENCPGSTIAPVPQGSQPRVPPMFCLAVPTGTEVVPRSNVQGRENGGLGPASQHGIGGGHWRNRRRQSAQRCRGSVACSCGCYPVETPIFVDLWLQYICASSRMKVTPGAKYRSVRSRTARIGAIAL